MYDTIIIGAGMSGLAAGIRLAHFDQRVCILERHTTIGGLNSFYRLRGRNYDVGLHAVTNFTPKGARKGPLARLLRQLRFRWDDFALAPQIGSAIAFPGVALRFSNDFELLRSPRSHRHFPAEKDNFRRLVEHGGRLRRPGSTEHGRRSARAVVGEIDRRSAAGRDALLPADVLRQRPRARHGLRPVLHHVPQHLPGGLRPALGRRAADPQEAGAQVQGRWAASCGCAPACSGSTPMAAASTRVVLDDGTRARRPPRPLLGRLARDDAAVRATQPPGRAAGRAGCRSSSRSRSSTASRASWATIARSSSSTTRERFHYAEARRAGRRAQRRDLLAQQFRLRRAAGRRRDAHHGPGQLRPLARTLAEGLPGWRSSAGTTGMVASAVRFMPDFRTAVIDTDMFTPTTIRRFTGHDNGAVYGAPRKALRRHART